MNGSRKHRSNEISEREEHVAAALRRYCPKGHVLDFPCGPGHLSRRLRELGYDVVAADISPQLCKAEGVRCVKADLDGRFEFDDESFDAVCCVAGIEHAENPYHVAREMHRVLKPSGLLMLQVPNFSSLLRRMRFMLSGRPTHRSLRPVNDEGQKVGGGHTTCLSVEHFRHVLAAARFDVVECSFFRMNNRTALRGFPLWAPMVAAGWLVGKSTGRWNLHETLGPKLLLNAQVLFVARKPASRGHSDSCA